PPASRPLALHDALPISSNPAIYAGQGVHWSEAYDELRALAEHLAIPVMTSLPGKSAFDETHPLALGSGGNGINGCVRTWLDECEDRKSTRLNSSHVKIS